MQIQEKKLNSEKPYQCVIKLREKGTMEDIFTISSISFESGQCHLCIYVRTIVPSGITEKKTPIQIY